MNFNKVIGIFGKRKGKLGLGIREKYNYILYAFLNMHNKEEVPFNFGYLIFLYYIFLPLLIEITITFINKKALIISVFKRVIFWTGSDRLSRY